MQTLLATVIAPDGASTDVELPGEVPIRELLRTLCSSNTPSLQSLQSFLPPGMEWSFRLEDATTPLPPGKTLLEVNVVDGSTLMIQQVAAPANTAPPASPVSPPFSSGAFTVQETRAGNGGTASATVSGFTSKGIRGTGGGQLMLSGLPGQGITGVAASPAPANPVVTANPIRSQSFTRLSYDDYRRKFYRPPRSYPTQLPAGEITIHAPLKAQQNQSNVTTWIQALLPIVGGLTSIVFFLAYPTNRFLIFIIAAVVLLSAGGMIFTRYLQQRTLKKQREAQSAAYHRHLEKCKNELEETIRQQQLFYQELYSGPEHLLAFAFPQQGHGPGLRLWERRMRDKDFLAVRIGLGEVPLCRNIQLDISNDPMVEYEPKLLDEAEEIVKAYSTLANQPIVLPLRTIGTLAITGPANDTRAFVRALLCQVAAFHAPEDVRIMAYFPPQAETGWTWLRWLPHSRRLRQVHPEKQSDPEALCLIASTVEDYRELLKSQLLPELKLRREKSADTQAEEDSGQIMKPHIIMVIDGFKPHGDIARIAELDEIFREAAQLGVTLICLTEERRHEPTAIEARISFPATGDLSAPRFITCEHVAFGGERQEHIRADGLNAEFCNLLARKMAPFSLADARTQQDLSQDVRLLDLCKVASADTIQTNITWQPRSRADIPNIPIGLQASGDELKLNFKEAAEDGVGPHGLVVGATGSGKSELLRTIVSSLSITHSPDMVNFVLVDFKGGAAFAAFEKLPHVAGIITNLQDDPTLINRAYASLKGERSRRERLLRDAGDLKNIWEYQEKWKSHKDSMKPMPHLLIIVDEFAELIREREDFLALFVMIGQVGRSLGMHLLLATQRLEEGRLKGLDSHLGYRICLRTFSAAESTTVIGNPSAYYLPSTPGIGYIKTGANMYDLFKTALISLPYVPSAGQNQLASRIRLFSPTGKLVPLTSVIHVQAVRMAGANPMANDTIRTEMEAVIDRLKQESGGQKVHQVWLPPLPRDLKLGAIHPALRQSDLRRAWQEEPPCGLLCIPIGKQDRPLAQKQDLLQLDFAGAGGHLAIIGAPQSGKSTLLRTILTAFILTHSPRDVQFYCIDLGGGLLRSLTEVPHVGEVCTSTKSEGEKVRRLIRQVRAVIEERELLFREKGIDNITIYRERRRKGEFSDNPFGDVFLVIDNLYQLTQDFDQMEGEIAEIVSNGLTYGVHVIVTANRRSEIRPRIFDNIATRLELHVNDPLDSMINKNAAAALPTDIPGRGLTQEPLQFQVALPGDDSATTPREAVEKLVQGCKAAWPATSKPAPPILMLPPKVTWQTILNVKLSQPMGLPLGLEEFQLRPVFIDLSKIGPHFLIFGDTEAGKTTLLRTLIQGILRGYSGASDAIRFAMIDYRKTLLDMAEIAEGNYLLDAGYAYTPTTAQAAIAQIKATLEKRMSSSNISSIRDLRNQQSWQGPHYFLFVDDYDLVAGGLNNPLSPLLEFLQHARDVGFHLVLARRLSGLGRSGIDQALTRLREMRSPLMVMNGDPQEGRQLLQHNMPPLPAGRGYFVQRNRPSALVQVTFTVAR